MGYSARLANSEGPIVIPIERIPKVLQALEIAQDCDRGGWKNDHLSWCERVESYAGTPTERLMNIVEAFGFDNVEQAVDLEGADVVEIHMWGGDKLGSDWDLFWDILAAHATEATTWVMVGEDGELFAERVDGKGQHTSPKVTIGTEA